MAPAARRHHRAWLTRSGLGLALVGAGYSIAWEAGYAKHAAGVSTWGWVARGTLGLVVLNAGLSIFGDGILARVRYEALTGELGGGVDASSGGAR